MSGLPRGPLLALDSSGRSAYVAVEVDGRVVAEEIVSAQANASSALLPAVDRAVAAAGLRPADVAAVVCGGGPGSFTGLRIAAATAKGIVRALGVPLYAYSGLMAAAAAHRVDERPVCALFDARNREVYAGCWSFGDDSVREELLAVAALGIDELVQRLRGVPVRFVGDGAALHRDALVAEFGGDAVDVEDRSLARGLLWLARAAPEAGRVADAAAWEPEYVRAAGVERIAATKAGA
ncbi:MAG TPA: tRNA (adenosine(37)-N6)-threonylcarbamoyltransferase complex dimerization subunit type 1 TsaB [Longimicrobium sp.]|uniref:tRNA (adenosine(37)-N6)-threonylcarbamoyltransferase complex dimerization subunit type 1 TsaB n=1 Tax=Longimicrobium sp. TaxID=2029185 RepID=UPI002EDB5BFB